MGNGASTFRRDLDACNFDQVKSAINRNISDPREKIQTIARSPLTSIEVRIPGIGAAATICKPDGDQEADILDYYGKVLSADFKVTQAELNEFQEQVVREDGLSATIKFRFQARSHDGSVVARFNIDKLVAIFKAAAGAKGLASLGAADLKATLGAVLNEQSVQITSEAGSGDFARVAEKIIEKVLKEVSIELEKQAKSENSKETSKENSKDESKGESKGESKDKKDKDESRDNGAKISVALAIDILKSKLSSEISYNSYSAPETANAQTELRIKIDRLLDPNVSEVHISAGYQDPSLGWTVKAGASFSISAAYWYTDAISYRERISYLTRSDLNSLALGSYFPNIMAKGMRIRDIETNGTVLAEGRWSLFKVPSPTTYRWVRKFRYAERMRQASAYFEPTLEGINSIPVYLTFSTIGDRRYFKFSELFVENPYWQASFDAFTGRLTILAKQDLGIVTFRERMSTKNSLEFSKEPLILDQVVEAQTDIWGRAKKSASYVLKKDDQAIIKQRTTVLYVSRPMPTTPPTQQSPQTAPLRMSLPGLTSDFTVAPVSNGAPVRFQN
jgi:hypothetical protein